MPTDDETLKRDREILTHIQHRYDEEERRFQTVDSKISSMIAVLIMIFTIQGSLFTNILSNMDKLNIFIIVLFIISLVLYLVSIGFFIKAHYFKKFSATPKPSFLMNEGSNDESEHTIVKDMIALYGDCVNENEEIIENKTSIAKKGFNFLIYGGCLSFIFFVCFLFELFI
ncbi:hypothetical protein [Methanobrevibacter sp.]|uniref:hypothetical protein n=1 Tax=Methanobrevibacter sp. TaxID=66852 RepID=UPI00388CFC3B